VVVTGAGTARAEGYEPVRQGEVDAALRARLGLAPVPALFVVSRSLDLPDHLLTGTEAGSPATVVVTSGAAAAAVPDRLAAVRRRAEVLVCGDAGLDPLSLREELAGRGLRRVLCEGGSELTGALAGAGALDEVA